MHCGSESVRSVTLESDSDTSASGLIIGARTSLAAGCILIQATALTKITPTPFLPGWALSPLLVGYQ